MIRYKEEELVDITPAMRAACTEALRQRYLNPGYKRALLPSPTATELQVRNIDAIETLVVINQVYQ